MGARAALIVFARAPAPGAAKTRLAAAVGPDGAAALSGAFLRDTIDTARRVAGVELAIACAGDADHPAFRADALGGAIPRVPQVGGDLGARLEHAMRRGFGAAPAVVVIGSDAPTLPAELLGRAVDMLDDHALVLGPCHDGGFYLLGARVVPRLDGVAWSTARALADVLARNAGHAPALLPPWYDVDTPDDLRLLRAHLALRPRLSPATARLLARF